MRIQFSDCMLVLKSNMQEGVCKRAEQAKSLHAWYLLPGLHVLMVIVQAACVLRAFIRLQELASTCHQADSCAVSLQTKQAAEQKNSRARQTPGHTPPPSRQDSS